MCLLFYKFSIQMVVHSRVEELPLRMLYLQPCANGKLAIPETDLWLWKISGGLLLKIGFRRSHTRCILVYTVSCTDETKFEAMIIPMTRHYF